MRHPAADAILVVSAPAGATQRIKDGLMMDSSVVSAELSVWLVLPEQMMVPLVARLFYSSEDPYAVSIAFEVGLDEPVEWVFARELLAKGIEGREGLGDVTVWPSAGSEGGVPGDVLHIELSSRFAHAHFEAPATEISDFLRRTYQIVPAGNESGYVDVEAELSDLLRQAS
jgi:hypothetical protein